MLWILSRCTVTGLNWYIFLALFSLVHHNYFLINCSFYCTHLTLLTDKCKYLYSSETHLAKLGGPQKATPLLSSIQRRLAEPRKRWETRTKLIQNATNTKHYLHHTLNMVCFFKLPKTNMATKHINMLFVFWRREVGQFITRTGVIQRASAQCILIAIRKYQNA